MLPKNHKQPKGNPKENGKRQAPKHTTTTKIPPCLPQGLPPSLTTLPHIAIGDVPEILPQKKY